MSADASRSIHQAELEALAEQFTSFASQRCHVVSPLYERLVTAVADDMEMLEFVRATGIKQSAAALLLASAHYLLLRGTHHQLSGYYASLSHDPIEGHDPYPDFKDFCLAHAQAIKVLMTTRSERHIEVRRCAHFPASFCAIAARGKKKPLTIIELAPYTPLSLVWDKYEYMYGPREIYGDRDSTVHITSRWLGHKHPHMAATLPEIAHRIGLNVDTIDITNTDAVLWLRSLMWPECMDDFELFNSGLEVALEHPPKLIGGTLEETLAKALKSIPSDTTPCIYSMYLLSHCPMEVYDKLLIEVEQYGAHSDIYWLFDEYGRVELTSYVDGNKSLHHLANVERNGRTVEWLDKRIS